MASTEAGEDDRSGAGRISSVDLKLEAVVIPVSDVDRAKGFSWASDGATDMRRTG